MSVRVNQRWPDGLKERVEAKVGRSKVTEFTVEALEKALGHRPAQVKAGDTVAPRPPASSRAPVVHNLATSVSRTHVGVVPSEAESGTASRACSRCLAPIKSPSLRRHDACGGGKVLPEPV